MKFKIGQTVVITATNHLQFEKLAKVVGHGRAPETYSIELQSDNRTIFISGHEIAAIPDSLVPEANCEQKYQVVLHFPDMDEPYSLDLDAEPKITWSNGMIKIDMDTVVGYFPIDKIDSLMVKRV